MKLMHYVSSNISLPEKSQLSLKLLWSLWQWNSMTEQCSVMHFSSYEVDKMPLCGQQGEQWWKSREGEGAGCTSALTGGQDRDRAVASAASPCAVSTRVGCPAHGCTLESSIFSSTTKTTLGSWGKTLGISMRRWISISSHVDWLAPCSLLL